eukprot:1353189-Amorphochlora_amoeboformis.AAC.2
MASRPLPSSRRSYTLQAVRKMRFPAPTVEEEYNSFVRRTQQGRHAGLRSRLKVDFRQTTLISIGNPSAYNGIGGSFANYWSVERLFPLVEREARQFHLRGNNRRLVIELFKNSQIYQRSRASESTYPYKAHEEHATASAIGPIQGMKGGSSCHQCKSRRLFEDLTYCTSSLDSKKKTCRKKYCEHCLRKFYNEPHIPPKNKASWICPSCRRICCCAACRRKELKQGGTLTGNNRKSNRFSRPIPMDYDAVLDLEELRLINIRNENGSVEVTNSTASSSAVNPAIKLREPPVSTGDIERPAVAEGSDATKNGAEPVRVEEADTKPHRPDSSSESPPLRETLAYMMAISQFSSVKEMLRRVTCRKGVPAHEK